MYFFRVIFGWAQQPSLLWLSNHEWLTCHRDVEWNFHLKSMMLDNIYNINDGLHYYNPAILWETYLFNFTYIWISLKSNITKYIYLKIANVTQYWSNGMRDIYVCNIYIYVLRIASRWNLSKLFVKLNIIIEEPKRT